MKDFFAILWKLLLFGVLASLCYFPWIGIPVALIVACVIASEEIKKSKKRANKSL